MDDVGSVLLIEEGILQIDAGGRILCADARPARMIVPSVSTSLYVTLVPAG